MAEEEEASAAILKSLKFSPRGLSITDLAKKTGRDRNAIAKRLDVLRAEGKVEVRLIGTARVYSLAQRVPLSAFLCFTRNMILILDREFNVVQANDKYLALAGCTKDELIGKNLIDANLPIVSTPDPIAIIGSTGKEQVIADICAFVGDNELFFKMEVIPTTFEAGDTGLTIVLENITEKERHLKNMEFLARTAMELVDLPPDMDIYQYIGDRIMELIPENPRCWITSYDEMKRQFDIRATINQLFREGVSRLMGRDPVGVTLPIEEFFFNAPFFESPSSLKNFREMHFHPFFEDEQISFYDVCARQIPVEVCNAIVRTFNIGKLFLIGLVWQEKLFGVVGICLSPDETFQNKPAVESFVRQASIAISRRMTEERLMRSEQRFGELVTHADHPATVINPEGRITFVNPQFTETFGYTKDDIPTMEKWFEKAFPDQEYHSERVSVVKPDTNGVQDIPQGEVAVVCRNGGMKSVVFRPVTLSDGTKVIWLCEGSRAVMPGFSFLSL